MLYTLIGTIVFLAASAALVYISRNALRRPSAHGFYRFFAWECILVLLLINLPVASHHLTLLMNLPATSSELFSPLQISSSLLLVLSLWLTLHAFRLLRHIGAPSATREDPALISFERTSVLVTAGAFRYIRHPMYTALIFLTWGIFLKVFSWPGLALTLAATVFLFLAALREERECLTYFGDAYAAYMGNTRRFVPFLL